jgi:protein-L-isoaspartate(D-aspartate) O-methyltransferase
MGDVNAARLAFAALLREQHGVRSEPLLRAFASVPREAFVGPGPWLMLQAPRGYESTPDADACRLYSDMAVGLDPARRINNSAPGVLARLLDAVSPAEGETVVEIGCGTGYYCAILAEAVGPAGRVIAIEIDPEFARRARRYLAPWKQVEVHTADGTRAKLEPVDAIVVGAGVTHPQPGWLDALRPGGRIVLPMTGIDPPPAVMRFGRNLAGRALLLTRKGDRYAARFLERLGISPCLGGREPGHEQRLRRALQGGGAEGVRSLRREPHAAEGDCWLHGPAFCLSYRAV